MEDIQPITHYKDLMKTLGRKGIKIAYETGCYTLIEDGKGGRKPYRIYNPYTIILQECISIPRELDDILRGVASLDWHRNTDRSIPLSVNKLYYLLSSCNTLSTSVIQSRVGIGKKMAQKYLRAIKIVWKWIEQECIHLGSQYIKRYSYDNPLRGYPVQIGVINRNQQVEKLPENLGSQYIKKVVLDLVIAVQEEDEILDLVDVYL